MSNISRRKFLKGAGVAALAVAAAGVLAGCSGNGDKVPGTNVPDQPGITSANIHVMFTDTDGNGISGAKVYDTTVLKDTKKYDPSLIPAEALPEGYKVADKTPVDIVWKTEMEGYVTVAIVLDTDKMREVTVKYYQMAGSTKLDMGQKTIYVDKTKGSLTKAEMPSLPSSVDGYVVVPSEDGPFAIEVVAEGKYEINAAGKITKV